MTEKDSATFVSQETQTSDYCMSEDDTEQRSFSVAVFESVFEEMKESPYITITDYAAMGSMPEQDFYVSFTVDPNGGESA